MHRKDTSERFSDSSARWAQQQPLAPFSQARRHCNPASVGVLAGDASCRDGPQHIVEATTLQLLAAKGTTTLLSKKIKPGALRAGGGAVTCSATPRARAVHRDFWGTSRHPAARRRPCTPRHAPHPAQSADPPDPAVATRRRTNQQLNYRDAWVRCQPRSKVKTWLSSFCR
jgi:hypothetical protein